MKSGRRVFGVINDFRGVWNCPQTRESEGSDRPAPGCLGSQRRTSLNAQASSQLVAFRWSTGMLWDAKVELVGVASDTMVKEVSSHVKLIR